MSAAARTASRPPAERARGRGLAGPRPLERAGGEGRGSKRPIFLQMGHVLGIQIRSFYMAPTLASPHIVFQVNRTPRATVVDRLV